MKIKLKLNILLFFFILFNIYPNFVKAGGIYIYPETVRINGYPMGSTFLPNQDILMSYTAQDYYYSGEEYEYFIFVIKKISNISIKKSVGKGGQNIKKDVTLIQKLLKEKQYFSGEIYGINDKILENAIKKFQKFIGIKKPDSRIDPNGFTLQKLSDETKPIIFVQLARTTRQMREIKYNVEFSSPQNGSYNIFYCHVPLFSDFAIGKLRSYNKIVTMIQIHIRTNENSMIVKRPVRQ